MEQKYLTDANNDEYLKQAPFEISINKIMDMIDNANCVRNPIYSEVSALYFKCKPILQNKDINDLYEKIEKSKSDTYLYLMNDYKKKYSRYTHDSPPEHIKFIPEWKLRQAAAAYTYKIIRKDCEKIYELIIDQLIAKKLILPKKGLLGSSHMDD